ncbi:hypothetical protein [Pseudoduganella violaceinigra]|uniref:hypothetical protein n=1 Tax=Pseudoduganella violaceinigra TaxID=246602 RepID=UPI000489F62E|nr:hypothetical protein [Pseudoduganella violaceinigra]
MAIDYFASFPCQVREAVSDADLLRMIKARNRASMVAEVMRKDPKVDKSKPESDWTFQTIMQRPEGPEETQMRIGDLIEESAPLNALKQHCVACPANVRNDDFGCGGAVHYPLSASTERWLVSRLPDDLDSPRGLLLTRAINDFQFDGAAIDAARGRKELYEANLPAERKWGGFFSKKTRITSSQILHMAFNVGDLAPAHAKLVAYFLGFLNDDFSPKDNLDDSPQPGDEQGVAELKYFFIAAALAGLNEVQMLVDA